MPISPTLISFTASTTILSSAVNSNFTNLRDTLNTYAVLTDVARTVTVTHTFTAAQTLTGGFTAGAASSVAGALTVTTAKTTLAATAAGYASLNLPHGTAPSSPADGDVWTTTGGLYARINGATQGPYSQNGGSGTSGKVTRWTATNTLANGSIDDNGTYVSHAAQPRTFVGVVGFTVSTSSPNGTPVTWQVAEEEVDVGGMFNAGTPTVLTVPANAGGTYDVLVTGNFLSDADGTAVFWLAKNGTQFGVTSRVVMLGSTHANYYAAATCHAILELAAGDEVSFRCYAVSGVTTFDGNITLRKVW